MSPFHPTASYDSQIAPDSPVRFDMPHFFCRKLILCSRKRSLDRWGDVMRALLSELRIFDGAPGAQASDPRGRFFKIELTPFLLVGPRVFKCSRFSKKRYSPLARAPWKIHVGLNRFSFSTQRLQSDYQDL